MEVSKLPLFLDAVNEVSDHLWRFVKYRPTGQKFTLVKNCQINGKIYSVTIKVEKQ